MNAILMAARAVLDRALAIGVVAATACGSDEHRNEAPNFGTVTLPLLTAVGPNTYRLQAVFVISGAQGDVTLSTRADEASLSTTLPTGSYSAFLESFTLYKDDGTGTFNPVVATVESNTEPFTVFADSTTTVNFQFETDGAPGAGGSDGTGGSAGCVHVAPDGDDVAGVMSDGTSSFRNVQPAIDFAATHPGAATSVCVAAGPACGATAEYPGPDGAALTMRNGIAVLGQYESTGWTRCPDSETVLVPRSARGVVFGSDIRRDTLLDGFTVRSFAATSTASITVDRARRARLVAITTSQPRTFRPDRSYGIDVESGDVLVAHSDVFSGFGQFEAIGVRSIGSHVVIEEGTTLEADGAGEVIGVFLQQSPGSRIQDSSIAANGSPHVDDVDTRVIALDVTGDATDLVIERNGILAATGRLDTRAISLVGCAGGAPRIVGNTVLARGPLGEDASIAPDVFAIWAADACHPLIASNDVRTATGNASGAWGVACAPIGSRARCVITDNTISLTNQTLQPGVSTFGYAVSCNECDEVSRNMISGLAVSGCFRDCEYGSVGVDAFEPLHNQHVLLIDGNQIEGGCGGGPLGLDGFGVTGIRMWGVIRVQNNLIYGSQCDALENVAKSSGIMVADVTVDIDSNFIDGGRADAPTCSSVGIDILDSGFPLIRNNIISSGRCPSGANIKEESSVSDPTVLENNDFLPGPPGSVLYVDEGSTDLVTVEAVNELTDTVSEANFSAACALPLTSGSPCIDTGTPEGAPDHDIDGDPRNDGAPDVGPDEFVGSGCSPHTGSGSVTASALIDGRSILSVSRAGFSWQHLDFAGPGMHEFQTLPTTIEVTLDGRLTSYSWCPTWPNGCNTCDGSCGELREPMVSTELVVPVSPGSLTVSSLTCSGRAGCELMQTPDATNGYVALIDMNDDQEGGAAIYSATLTYTYEVACK